MFKKLKISQKLVIFMVLIGIIPLLLGILFANSRVSQQLLEDVFNKLKAVQNIKQYQVTHYINRLRVELQSVKDDPYCKQALLELNAAFMAAGNKFTSLEWNTLARKYDSRMKNIQRGNGWYDLFFINPNGYIVYTTEREADLGMNIPDSELKRSSMGIAYEKVQKMGSDSIAIADFKPYSPSNGDPAAFMIAQMRDADNKIIGFVALQFPVNLLDEIMMMREGLGETGETYLVGSDNRMRSTTFLDKDNRNVKASFIGTIEKNGIDTEATRAALKGRSGEKIIQDYVGKPVLSVYSPIKIAGFTWALMAEMNEEEAIRPAKHMRNILFLILFVLAIIVGIVGYLLARTLSNPINIMVKRTKNLTGGEADLTRRIKVDNQGELGELSNHFNQFIERIQALIVKVKGSADSVSSASLQISSSSEELSATVEEQSAQSQSVSSAVTELTATSDDISKSIESTRGAAEDSTNLTKDGSKVIKKSIDALKSIEEQTGNLSLIITNLGDSTQKIGNIINVINDVADQTNLLALNAAIEAARAGDAGRGFAVVADEVRRLAERTAKATKEIEEIITQLQQEANNAEMAMGDASKEVEKGTRLGEESLQILEKIVVSSDNIFNAAISVSAAVTQENATIEEVNTNIHGIAIASEESAKAVQEVALTAEDLSKQAENLKEMVDQFIT
jgi:methyl-accepting chemotaxis protein